MIELKDLLSSFSDKLFKEEIKKDAIRDALHEVLGIEVKKEDIKIQNGTVFLNVKPLYKSEILLKREKILSLIQESIHRISDIR